MRYARLWTPVVFLSLLAIMLLNKLRCSQSLLLRKCFSRAIPSKWSRLTQRYLFSTAQRYDDILQRNHAEILSLQGKPELVDHLQHLASKHPGIVTNSALYRLLYPFPIDAYQEEGIQALREGKNVLVTTPTGSGKTLVAELAIYFALMLNLRIAYTTPLKALSNQKFQDFSRKFGAQRVGLLTGDISINRNAEVLVMTTEVYRNMIYDSAESEQLKDIFMVCFDEFHYMNDPERGTVWEESIISCPPHIRVLALSATMGNVEEVRDWLSIIHGPTALVQSDHRPVPLRYFYATKKAMLPFFRSDTVGPGAVEGIRRLPDGNYHNDMKINADIIRLEEEEAKRKSLDKKGKFTSSRAARFSPPSALIPKHTDVVKSLQKASKLPAIFFIFSRVGCEEAAQFTTNEKLGLLSGEELQTVNKALAHFIRNNPVIPITRQNILMLQAGVGVHHAGLIGVWKSFVEDLFNANLIKVLYATETLAAGVNMPARTTVINALTKKIKSEVIQLKTSQVLQMAGRAGRRGIDVEGNVVIMRNAFDELKLAHSTLVSKVDGIKSHFKASYGFAVKLLETRSLPECRALVERGFGAYSMMKRVQRRASLGGDIKTQQDRKREYRALLLKYGVKVARNYVKAVRRCVREERQLLDLEAAAMRQSEELAETLVQYAPLGTALKLRSGETAFLLGETQPTDSTATLESIAEPRSYLAITSNTGRLLKVYSNHIQAVADVEAADNLSGDAAVLLRDFLSTVSDWQPSVQEDLIGAVEAVADWSAAPLSTSSLLQEAMHQVKGKVVSYRMEADPVVTAQQLVVNKLQQELSQHAISQAKETQLVIEAVKYLGEVKNPEAWLQESSNNEAVQSKVKTTTVPEYNIYAWKLFENTLEILRRYKALDTENRTTPFGELVSSFTTENELWLATILQQDGVERLNASELAALVCATMVDGKRANSVYVTTEPSDKVKDVILSLEEQFLDLHSVQEEVGLEFPIHMGGEVCGIAEVWCQGASWKDLCSVTSLDQGDLCKILRRTMELLQQIPEAYRVKAAIRVRADEAVRLMNRFPVANTMDNDHYNTVDAPTAQESERLPCSVSGNGSVTEEVIEVDTAVEAAPKKKSGEGMKKPPALSTYEGFQLAFSPDQPVEVLEKFLNDLSSRPLTKSTASKSKAKKAPRRRQEDGDGKERKYQKYSKDSSSKDKNKKIVDQNDVIRSMK